MEKGGQTGWASLAPHGRAQTGEDASGSRRAVLTFTVAEGLLTDPAWGMSAPLLKKPE